MAVTAEKITEKTVRKIYRCTNKACKYTWAYDYTARTTTLEGDSVTGYWRESKTKLYRNEVEESRLQDNICPECGKSGNGGDKVQGGISSHEKCGPKCWSAKGHICECECKGANHGANHL